MAFLYVRLPPEGGASSRAAAKGCWEKLIAGSETLSGVRCGEALILTLSTGLSLFNSHSALWGTGRCWLINSLKIALLT